MVVVVIDIGDIVDCARIHVTSKLDGVELANLEPRCTGKHFVRRGLKVWQTVSNQRNSEFVAVLLLWADL
jgi:hypothetical protein